MSLALVALLLAAAVSGSASGPPDYVGTMRNPFGEGTASIRSHAGAFRMDFPRANGEVEAEYDAPGQLPLVITVRDLKGEVTNLWIRAQQSPRPFPNTAWMDAGQERTLAGETCRMQRPAGADRPDESQCVTADGVNLLPRREGRLMEMRTLVRAPVPPSEVTPPIELMDLTRWIPADALIDRPDRPKGSDYVATFSRGKTVRRSGAWTLVNAYVLGPTASLVNDELGFEVRVSKSGAAPNDLWIRRFAPGRRLGAFAFEPALMEGKATETVLGEVCHWLSRPSTPDAIEYECRADDGALLAIGFGGMGRTSWEPAKSFRREPVPLSSILLEPTYFRPAHYGLLPATAAARR